MALFDFMGKRKVELLAPAGNYESFLGAIHAGADAVYLGGEKFGARAYADNFTGEEICRAISYAHLFNRKVYLTVNTLIKDSEFPELLPYLEPFYLAGLDGVIVQDIGALLAIRNAFPKLAIHISTQMTVTGAYTAARLKELGAVRIVPARELSLSEVTALKQETGLEMETFIHGAMCYCYSGQCLFSSILGGRSGNRGRCAQPCRLPYRILENGKPGKEQYPLSLKDMCTISCLPDLIEAGIDSFKIEGRMKKPEYAAGVTAIYRKYLEIYEERGKAGYRVEEADLKKLSALYIRSGIQDGYYFKRNGADMITPDSPAYSGSDDALLAEIRRRFIDTPLKKEISMNAVFSIGECAKLTITCADGADCGEMPVSVTVYGEKGTVANKQPVTEENIRKGLMKLGNTSFTTREENVQITVDDGLFYPLKAINELRREGLERMEKALICSRERATSLQSDPLTMVESRKTSDGEKMLCTERTDLARRVLVSTEEQLQTLLQSGFATDILYLDSEMSGLSPALLDIIRHRMTDGKIFIALPYIIRRGDTGQLDTLYPLLNMADGCLVRCAEELYWLRKKGYERNIYTDAGVYAFNRQSLSYWLKEADGCALPYELNRRETELLISSFPGQNLEQIVYGRLPLMVTANCVAKTSGHCRKRQDAAESFALRDRYRKDFPVSIRCQYCYNVIYNSVPLSLHEKVYEDRASTAIRISFTVESGQETDKVLTFFAGLLQGENLTPPYAEYTLGHEKRGVL